MKTFNQFLQEAQMTTGFTNADNAAGPVAGFDKRLFPPNEDDLSQDYQTPAEVGLNKWRFSNVYPVMKVTLDNNKGDGPSIDAMVDASKRYVDIMDKKTLDMIRNNLTKFSKP